MKPETIKNQLMSTLPEKGCSDTALCIECIKQTAEASEMFTVYSEAVSYALALYNARMWGRKKTNDCVQQERLRREKLFSEDSPCLAAPKAKPTDGEIQVGRLILRKRPTSYKP